MSYLGLTLPHHKPTLCAVLVTSALEQGLELGSSPAGPELSANKTHPYHPLHTELIAECHQAPTDESAPVTWLKPFCFHAQLLQLPGGQTAFTPHPT